MMIPTLLIFHLVGPVPSDLGVHNNQLSPCPDSAHCARNSWSTRNLRLDYAKLVSFVRDMPRTTIIEKTDDYLHAEVSSAFFGFVDDLEIYADSDYSFIQARSASRLGDSDLGVNTARLTLLEQVIQATEN
ncbi:hypothetical protein OMCYN_01707 [cyanobiont of Ornithocercus magnificus]|nr:hypothetical protein OMCYN_01707 [cyanobiont of Ornithocercus magnificus]